MSEYVRERSTREFARAGGGSPRNKVDRAFSSDEKIVSLFEPDLSSKTVTVSQDRRPREKMVLLLERRSEVKCERCLRDEAPASYRVFTETIDMRVCAECADEARKLRINVELLDSHSGKKTEASVFMNAGEVGLRWQFHLCQCCSPEKVFLASATGFM